MAVRGLVEVVVDDGATAQDLRAVLEGAGYQVRTVPGTEEAIEAAATQGPDLVVLDTALEHIDALECVTRLHRSELFRDLPVVLIAAEDDPETRVRGLEVGDDLIVTPLDPREILTRIERQVTVSTVRLALRESEAKFRSPSGTTRPTGRACAGSPRVARVTPSVAPSSWPRCAATGPSSPWSSRSRPGCPTTTGTTPASSATSASGSRPSRSSARPPSRPASRARHPPALPRGPPAGHGPLHRDRSHQALPGAR